jgi:hypothetical protein
VVDRSSQTSGAAAADQNIPRGFSAKNSPLRRSFDDLRVLDQRKSQIMNVTPDTLITPQQQVCCYFVVVVVIVVVIVVVVSISAYSFSFIYSLPLLQPLLFLHHVVPNGLR